jgi:hypothetical protein
VKYSPCRPLFDHEEVSWIPRGFIQEGTSIACSTVHSITSWLTYGFRFNHYALLCNTTEDPLRDDDPTFMQRLRVEQVADHQLAAAVKGGGFGGFKIGIGDRNLSDRVLSRGIRAVHV